MQSEFNQQFNICRGFYDKSILNSNNDLYSYIDQDFLDKRYLCSNIFVIKFHILHEKVCMLVQNCIIYWDLLLYKYVKYRNFELFLRLTDILTKFYNGDLWGIMNK